ncbi:hypothetical protein ACHRVW_23475 [Flavobacterium collinsii]|jgi:hypothetical protein|uniref:Uncharacterized protein n=1 Tax=Flavobacterium collinsii TaxID=1114861 RepID=A0ABN7EF89_9FLAO|nr:hypothetical protein [Flavobacterium collinsii]CAA9195383.1 hypothetical protein FLACOL7796_00609 [Flavobacterium collinsii]
MKNTQKIQLIKGSYSNEEAKEILFNLINAKINFHNLKNFSDDERSGNLDEISLKRITELTESKEVISEVINYATKENLKITIDNDIFLTVEAQQTAKEN